MEVKLMASDRHGCYLSFKETFVYMLVVGTYLLKHRSSHLTVKRKLEFLSAAWRITIFILAK